MELLLSMREMRNLCKTFRWEILEGKENCTGRHRWGDNIQMNLSYVGCELTGLNSLIKVSMVGSCIHDSEFSGFIRNVGFLFTSLPSGFSKTTPFYGFSEGISVPRLLFLVFGSQ
jgi:hypothetical protein